MPDNAPAPEDAVLEEDAGETVGTVSPTTGALQEIFPPSEPIPEGEVKIQVKGWPPFSSTGMSNPGSAGQVAGNETVAGSPGVTSMSVWALSGVGAKLFELE
jgi:hypothetical protein